MLLVQDFIQFLSLFFSILLPFFPPLNPSQALILKDLCKLNLFCLLSVFMFVAFADAVAALPFSFTNCSSSLIIPYFFLIFSSFFTEKRPCIFSRGSPFFFASSGTYDVCRGLAIAGVYRRGSSFFFLIFFTIKYLLSLLQNKKSCEITKDFLHYFHNF